MPPFLEDMLICEVAEAAGLTISRYESVEITDEAAVKAAGFVRQAIDYSRVRKLLADGVEVPGAKLGGVEYKLRRMA